MSKYGIDNVRGGTYCQVKLNDDIYNTIQKEIDGATDKCYKCGKHGHFASNCKKKSVQKKDTCFRCNRVGHYANNCYAKTYDNGEIIEDSDDSDDSGEFEECWSCQYCNKEFDTLKGATFHENVYCKKKNTKKKSNYY